MRERVVCCICKMCSKNILSYTTPTHPYLHIHTHVRRGLLRGFQAAMKLGMLQW